MLTGYRFKTGMTIEPLDSRLHGNDGRRIKIPSIDWILACASMTIEVLDSRMRENDE